MQTFLPSSNFKRCAEILDPKRLNKQILEGYQILNVLSKESKGNGWKNHPAVLMWKNAEYSLWEYIQNMIIEAQFRGIKTINNEINLNNLEKKVGKTWSAMLPSWMSDDLKLMKIITTHRVNLFKKDPYYYARFAYASKSPYNITCCSTCQYYWVTHEDRKIIK